MSKKVSVALEVPRSVVVQYSYSTKIMIVKSNLFGFIYCIACCLTVLFPCYFSESKKQNVKTG